MAVGHVSRSSEMRRSTRTAPRRGQVKAAIARSVVHAFASMVRSGARSVTSRRSYSWHRS